MAPANRQPETEDQVIQELEQQIGGLQRRLEALKSERSGAAHTADPLEPTTPSGNARRQRALRVDVLTYLRQYGPLVVLTAPIIYATAVPLVFLDLSLTIYQWTCFPIYGIAKVRRREFIVIDRYKLGYLNLLEKLNCLFCEYANGVLAYSAEIGSRTEEFWCPIRHKRQPTNEHPRACQYASYLDGVGYRAKQMHNGRKAVNPARRARACHSCDSRKD